MSRVIAVVGATGAQGGGLVQAILNDPAREFVPRALTRKPDSEAARRLADAGAEVVRADMDDQASLTQAFQGCHGAFCLTNFWEHFSAEKEKEQAQRLATAAAEAGIGHAIWSTLEDTRERLPVSDDRMPVLQGKYNVPHFDAKGEADQYFRDSGVPTTFLLTSFYWENFIYFGSGPQKGPDGKLALVLPMGDARLPGIGVADIGKCALGVFKAGAEYRGKTVAIAGGHYSGQEMADLMTAALGQPVGYTAVPADVYRSFPFDGADEMGNMYQYKRDFNESFCGIRDLATARKINPELQSLAAWLDANGSRIPLGD